MTVSTPAARIFAPVAPKNSKFAGGDFFVSAETSLAACASPDGSPATSIILYDLSFKIQHLRFNI
jgi:hypothetical protein